MRATLGPTNLMENNVSVAAAQGSFPSVVLTYVRLLDGWNTVEIDDASQTRPATSTFL